MKEISTTTKAHGNGGLRIHIPSKIRYDSLNPINAVGQDIKIIVDGAKMVITPIKNTPLPVAKLTNE